jgi:hypothetical protein
MLAAGGLTLLAGATLLNGTGGTHAATVCRTDPTVTLSNGAQVTLYEDISDSAGDVTGVSYQLHIPVGLTVKSIAYSGAVASSLQTITVKADENAGNYDAYTVLSTRTANISVTAYMSGTSNGATTVSCHTNGHNGQQLHSHLHLA